MKFIGLQEQIRRNRAKSILLLATFPAIVLAATFMLCCVIDWFFYPRFSYMPDWEWHMAIPRFEKWLPWVLGTTAAWLLGSYLWHSRAIERAVGSRSADPIKDERILRIVAKVSATAGIEMPQVRIIDGLLNNAFASGIDDRSYTLTFGNYLISNLNDDQLEGVVAHEISHIVNGDTKMLIIGLVFTGMFRIILGLLMVLGTSGIKEGGKAGAIFGFGFLVLMLSLWPGYISSVLTRLCLSRKREFLADAGAVELTGNASALASALRCISRSACRDAGGSLGIEAAMFVQFDNVRKWWRRLWSTHPDIERRIEILEQMDCMSYTKPPFSA